jgi:hypothetical protein
MHKHFIMLATAGIITFPTLAADLTPTRLVTPQATHPDLLAASSREPVQVSWAIQDQPAAQKPHVAQSREYYLEASADELAKGISLPTTSSRALIRMQPRGATGPREDLAIHPQSLELTDAAGKKYEGGNGMELLVTADKMAKADLPFAPGTSAFRVQRELGSGPLKLRAPGLAGRERYLINVVEPDSQHVMSLQAESLDYLHGQEVVLAADLKTSDGVRHAPSKITGKLISPGGRSIDVTFKAGKDGKLRVNLPLNADEEAMPGLWELQAHASASIRGQQLMRSVRTAFPVAMPTAKLDGSSTLESSRGGVTMKLGVEAVALGRYEVRGTLYGTVNGSLKALGVAHSAQWIEGGNSVIPLMFSAALLEGANDPFEVRDLTLLDQTRLGILQRKESGTRLATFERFPAPTAVTRSVVRIKLPPNATPR